VKEEAWHRAIVPVSYPTSIFAATKFHFRVRDGVEVGPLCHGHQAESIHPQDCIKEKKRSSPRSVSTPRLQTLLLFYLAPINGCSARDLTGLFPESTHLEVGFPLRCFQRLSTPHLATQRLPLAR
jgi:hypothetical protein